MTREYSAGAIIYRFREDGELEYLIVQSTVNKNWGFPKGHIEGDETVQQAAEREVFEEVGLKPEFDFNFKEQAEYQLTATKSKQVTYFLAKFVSNQEVKVQAEEILASKWISVKEAPEYLTVHNKFEILQTAQQYLSKKIIIKSS